MDERIEMLEELSKKYMVELLSPREELHIVDKEKTTQMIRNMCEAEYYICKSNFYRRK